MIAPELCTSYCQVLVVANCAGGPTMADCYNGCLDHSTCIAQWTAEYECIVADAEALVCNNVGVYLRPDHCVAEQAAATDCKYRNSSSALSSTSERRVDVVP